MRMQANHYLLSFGHASTKELDLDQEQYSHQVGEGEKTIVTYLVSIVVRSSNLHSRRQVEDDPINANVCFPPCSFDSVTDFDHEFRFCLRECFRAVLIPEVGSILGGGLIRKLPDYFGVGDSELQSLLLGGVEYNVAEARAYCVIHVYNRFLRSSH